MACVALQASVLSIYRGPESSGDQPPGGQADPSLRAWLEEYLRWRPGISLLSAEQLLVSVGLAERFCREQGGRPPRLSDCGPDWLLAWMGWLRESRSPATVNQKRSHLLALLRFAEERGILRAPGRIPKLPEPEREPVALELAEVERLFAAFAAAAGCWRGDAPLAERWAGTPSRLVWLAMGHVVWDTALRRRAVLGLAGRHFALERGLLCVPAELLKGGRSDRVFPLHSETVAAVAALQLGPDDRLLGGISKAAFQLRYRKILRAAGLPVDRRHQLHCLRRTVASHAAAARGIEWAAAAVGHTVAVARRSYVSARICRPPALIDAVPRPLAPAPIMTPSARSRRGRSQQAS